MPTLGAPLNFSQYEARNIRAHILGADPSSPVTGQMYYNSGNNTLWWYDGSQWVSARGGGAAIPPATTGALGTIQLAGDLAGTATSPQIAAGVITDADVNVANKDGAAATASMRTLGAGASQAAAGNDARFSDARAPTAHRTTHEPGGSDPLTVDAVVGTGSLRTLGTGAQQALAGNSRLNNLQPANASYDMNGFALAGLPIPVQAGDAANKSYVDNTVQGLDAKASVRAASTANLTLSGTQTVDTVPLVANDRVLVKDQTTAAQNGPYLVQAGAWIRTTDADTWNELVSAYVWVEQGSQQDTGWVCTVDQGGTLGTTNVTWTQFSGAGQITAGAGMTKSGNTLDVGQGAGITVAADTVAVANNGVTNAMLADGAVDLNTADVIGMLPVAKGGTGAFDAAGARASIGAASRYTGVGPPSANTTWTVTAAVHGISNWPTVTVYDVATRVVEIPDISYSPSGDVVMSWGVSQSTNSKRVVLAG